MSRRDREYRRSSKKDTPDEKRKMSCSHPDLKTTEQTLEGPAGLIKITWFRCPDCKANWNESRNA